MDIDKAIRHYNKLASRRDERINKPALDEIAAKLAEQVPPGQNNEVDPLLGRSCAVLPDRSAVRWSTDEQRAEVQAHGAAEAARLADEKREDFLTLIADQYDDMLDFMRLCGDLAL